MPIKIKNISNKPAFKSAVKNYLKITARNRELDDFSYDFKKFMCIVIIYIFMFLFFQATFCA